MPRYLCAEQLQWIHRRVIDSTGGTHAVRDLNLVQSAAVRPAGGAGRRDTYPTLAEKAAALLESLVLYHPFVDGNRRTALVAAGVFLEYNRRRLSFTPAEAERFLRRVGTGKMPLREVARWIEEHCRPAAGRRPATRSLVKSGGDGPPAGRWPRRSTRAW